VLEILAFAVLAVTGTPPPDSLRDAERAARSTAYRYEHVLRHTAPQRFGGGYRGPCDEVIGRFCFWYSSGGEPRPKPEAEPEEVTQARLAAIHAFQRWLALAPGVDAAAGPLVRYLIEAERPTEAVAVAGAHVWAADSSTISLLLLGMALHYTRDFVAAEAAFDSARARLSERERRRLDDVGVLLEPRERSRYNGLSQETREEYEAAFWVFSDPWLLQPGNERRSAHYARHAWSRILARTPRAQGMLPWGSDQQEIVLRYGIPEGRERILSAATHLDSRFTLLEWFDRGAVALGPPALLTGGLPEAPPPGIRPDLERDTARTRYAPLATRRIRGLVVQPSLFPGATTTAIRVDALLPPDTAAPRTPMDPRGLLVLMDTLGRVVARVETTPVLRPDSSTVLSAEVEAEPGVYVYRAEILDEARGLGGLAQYRIEVAAAPGLRLSDLLITFPVGGEAPSARRDGALAAIPDLVLPPQQTIGVYAEVSGLAPGEDGARLALEWWIEREPGSNLIGRALRWLGERVGLVASEPPIRIAWEEGGVEGWVPLFVTLDLARAEPGLNRLGLVVRDRVSGQERTATRLIRIDPDADPPLGPGNR
jgi:hypothetical protein